MPPLMPRASSPPRSSRRGGVRLQPPAAVAQVSAAAAARLPVTTQSPSDASWSPSSAPSAAGPPLAATCHGSRRSPFGSRPAGAGASRPITLLETKKAANTAPPAHPVPTSTAIPTSQAATAPPVVRLRTPQASSATRPGGEHRQR